MRPQPYRQPQSQAQQPTLAQQQSSAQSSTQQSTHHQHHHHHKPHTHHHHHHHHRSSQSQFEAASNQTQQLQANNEVLGQTFYHQQSPSLQNSGNYQSTSTSPLPQPVVQQGLTTQPVIHPQTHESNYYNINIPLNQIYRSGHASIDLIDDYDATSVSPQPASTISIAQQQQHQQQQRIQDNHSPSIGGISTNNSNNHATLASRSSTIMSNDNGRGNGGTNDPQLLPAHLKCGMWASLALASVFVAGAKFYFDHQGTGLEVLIFCAFSATFFIFACTVSLCRRAKDQQHQQSINMESDMDGGIYIGQVRFLSSLL